MILNDVSPIIIPFEKTSFFLQPPGEKRKTNAVQFLAGSGYIKGALVEKLMREAKLTQIFEGTNQINRIVSGRRILTGKSVLF
jgi:hypothetical protein